MTPFCEFFHFFLNILGVFAGFLSYILDLDNFVNPGELSKGKQKLFRTSNAASYSSQI